MALDLTILYRGPLSSCNYDCYYCPFAKHHESAAELAVDRQALDRFCGWLESRTEDRFSILFTPWGEGLVRRWYRDALCQLSNLRQVAKVAIQTNLSCKLDWVDSCDKSHLGLWCTWHPSQTSLEEFVAKCQRLSDSNVRYSAGVVGLREYFDDIEKLRRALPSDVYLWINAYKDQADYYSVEEVERLAAIDPLFRTNNTRHPSLGRDCRAGETVISVDGEGTVRRCHFIKTPLGNLYDANFERVLRRRACTNQTCGCHIGYVHMNELGLYERFGDGVLERIPNDFTWQGYGRVSVSPTADNIEALR